MATYDEAAKPLTTTANAVAELLAGVPGASDWQASALHDDEAQMYLIGDRVESRRTVANERTVVTVFNDHPAHAAAEGQAEEATARGLASVTLLAEDVADPDRAAARLRDAVTMASLTDSPPFALADPPAGGFPAVANADPALDGDLAAALDRAADQVRAAVARQVGVRLSSAELYATRMQRVLRTSRGIAVPEQSSGVSLDFVLIAGEGGKEAEIHAELRRRRLADFDLDQVIAAYASYARDSLRAVAPRTHRGPVLLSGEAATDFFAAELVGITAFGGPLATHTSAQAAYQRLSRLKLGEPITPEPARGDRITLISDPLLPYGVRTRAFDLEGLPGARLTLIEDGVFRTMWGGAQYASYMGIPPTGDLGNLVVRPGTTPLAALRDRSAGPLYEIVAFSSFYADPVTGDFVVEIKLGYRHDAGGTTSIKGGSLSGNVFAALGDARFSQEVAFHGSYLGPVGIRFGELTIAGE